MNKTLHEGNTFRLVEFRHRKQKNSAPMYHIIWYNWKTMSAGDEEIMRDMIDPERNIGGKYANTWKFRDRIKAEKMYIMLTMRWA